MSVATTVNHQNLASVDWEDILDTLKVGRCVLFLGAGAYQAPGGGDIEVALADWVGANDPDNRYIKLYNSDGFFLFKKRRYGYRISKEIKKFYNQPFLETETLFEKIVQTPFPMIFTLTPDNILSRTFEKLGFDYQTDFYFRHRRASEQYTTPTQSRPLIYNMLGNIEEPDSLVLTHNNFFDYLESVFIGDSMSVKIKEELAKMERYIFLGLPYERWYFQLLLRMLSLHSPKLFEIERLGLEEFQNPSLRKIYSQEFKIDFYPVNPEQFINELYKRCEEKKLLKPKPEPDQDDLQLPEKSINELREMVTQAKLKSVFSHLKVFLQKRLQRNKPLYNDFIVVQTRYNLLKQREVRGTIKQDDFLVEHNQIVEQVLKILGQAEEIK